MAAGTSSVLDFWLTAFFGVIGLAALASRVALLLPVPVLMASWLHRAGVILALCYFLCAIFVVIFGYRPRVKYFLQNRNGFLFSPRTAALWMIAAAELPSQLDGQLDRFSTLTALGLAALFVWSGWLLWGPKEQSAYAEKRDELDDQEMTRLKLI